MKINKELLNQINKFIDLEKFDSEEDILNSLKSQQETPKLKYLTASLLFDLGIRNEDLDQINEAIKIFEEIKEQDFDFVNYYLGTLNLVKYYKLKPNYLSDPDDLLFNSKLYLKQELLINCPETFREASVHLGIVYNGLGRTIESLDCFDNVLKYHNSTYALYNKAYALYTYSFFSINHSLIIRDAYNCFKIVLEDDNFSQEMKVKSKEYVDEILILFEKEFLESDSEEEIKIEVEDDFEWFMVNYCWENRLYLNLCNFCQKCSNSIGDAIVIEKMINEISESVENDSFLVLSSYLNQLKMDYVSARFLLILSQYDGFDLDVITKHVFIVDTQFSEENNIRIQLLKDAFKNFFNILDKIAYFMNDYLDLGVDQNYIGFQNVWFKKGKYNQGINEKLLKMDNYGLTALYDIYLELKKGNEKFYLRDTRNLLTHKYLRITENPFENSKTVEELHNETIEVAILVKNAIIYLLRLVKINENQKEQDLDMDFI
ncbi:LA2681 family HEPN domain-containing protein [uncultured Methanobrevibacter sp.]|uniref:LA2681 family HEPN domain-containing protein n=1 Tax=uncultured Methanobrevibacter sp. TaxID=253161 RepID=UPI0025F8E9B0|nr:LA2681 family HEPN domain-containing protein [uncultured Methanobrevibacter sp.]